MQGLGRHGVTRRLLAAALSLVLVTASIIGAHAHVCHEAHHQSASHVVFGGMSAVGADHDEDSSGSLPGSVTHALCSDFLCHGGIAILVDVGQFERLAQRAPAAFPAEDLRVGSGPSTLDRPPKVSVIA
jgi:hypothetical protein